MELYPRTSCWRDYAVLCKPCNFKAIRSNLNSSLPCIEGMFRSHRFLSRIFLCSNLRNSLRSLTRIENKLGSWRNFGRDNRFSIISGKGRRCHLCEERGRLRKRSSKDRHLLLDCRDWSTSWPDRGSLKELPSNHQDIDMKEAGHRHTLFWCYLYWSSPGSWAHIGWYHFSQSDESKETDTQPHNSH